MTTAGHSCTSRERLDRVRQQQGRGLADRLLATRTARRVSRSRSVPPIMVTSFMANADYLALIAILATSPKRCPAHMRSRTARVSSANFEEAAVIIDASVDSSAAVRLCVLSTTASIFCNARSIGFGFARAAEYAGCT